jgi:hypothetical protein
MLFEVMEQMASAVTQAKVARRPVFGPTRVSVLRRVNKHCISGTTSSEPKKEEVVEVLVQSGTVREGQMLEAVLPAPTVFSDRHCSYEASMAVATFTVVGIQRLGKPRFAPNRCNTCLAPLLPSSSSSARVVICACLRMWRV